jgi:hypothetical protein
MITVGPCESTKDPAVFAWTPWAPWGLKPRGVDLVPVPVTPCPTLDRVLRCESVNLRLAEGLSIPKKSLRVFLGERNIKNLITWPQSLDVFSGRGSFLMGLHGKSCRNEEWRRCVGHTATNFKTLPLDVGMHDDQKGYRIIQAPTIAPSTH